MNQDGTQRHEDITRIFVRPIGSPLPMGFFAFGMGVFIFSAFDFGWIPVSERKLVAMIFFTFSGPMEVLAMILAFLARDTAGGTTLAIFSASWLVFSLYIFNVPAGTPSRVIAFFSLMLAMDLIGLCILSWKSKPLFSVLQAAAAFRFCLTSAQNFGAGWPVRIMGGAVGLLTTAIAIYGAFALMMEDAKQHEVLPIFRRGKSRKAMEGDIHEQLSTLTHEAGVRRPL